MNLWDIDRAAGVLLVLSSVVLLPGLLMFWFRQGHKGGAPRSQAHYTVERAFVAAWVILSAVGFVLFTGAIPNGPGKTLALAGAAAYFFASILLAAAEILSPTSGYGKMYRLAASYVVIAFLAQAAFGGAVLQSGIAAAWAGWVSVLWNLAGLVVIPLISPGDIYFPVLHSIAPLLIGIALLIG